MNRPTKREIEHCLGRLREIVESDENPILTRMAYAVETAITWAATPTEGWSDPSIEVRGDARRLKDELRSMSVSELIASIAVED